MPHRTHRLSSLVALAVALSFAAWPQAGRANDADLFTTTAVTPNVLLLIDNSASMNHIIWHDNFVNGTQYTCNQTAYGAWDGTTTNTGAFDPNAVYFFDGNRFGFYDALGGFQTLSNYKTQTHCGRTRDLIHDPNAAGSQIDLLNNNKWTRFTGAYLNWLFSAEADASWADITNGANGLPSSCVGGSSYAKYQRTRMNVAKQILKDVVCQVNLVGQVRFGIAVYRTEGTGTNDPNGGYVLEEVDVPTSNQQADLVSAIQSIRADTHAPMSESLFQLYTYFMSRTAPAKSVVTPTAQFPAYVYDTTTTGVGGTNTGKGVPPDPVIYSCQKNFIIIVTDGDSEMDDFQPANPTSTAVDFGIFDKLIGDYVKDGEVELPGGANQTSRYLDDIAKYMTENDMRPDFSGSQTIDTYTVGFTTDATANAMLQKAAVAGNGLFFGANDEAQLAQAIIDALTSIIEKAQSFTAATVPASRTADGEQIYISLFTPTSKTSYWNGRLRSYKLTAAGEILDVNGNCAIIDPTGNCFSGPFKDTVTAPPFWDAADHIPAPASRNLWTTRVDPADPVAGPMMLEDFRHTSDTPTAGNLVAADLGVVYPPPTVYGGSTATTDEELTADIIMTTRGCEMGTGTRGVPCVVRQTVLNDIFHSNPVVVGSPFDFLGGTYKDFRTNLIARDRVIYAGSNSGFFHGFHAGTYDATKQKHDAGTGAELFGFMPWPARQNIKEKPIDVGQRDYYYVDGSPTAGDILFYDPANADIESTNWQDWRTLIVSGMREGGEAYFALDVTDPAGTSCPAPGTGSGYPCYLWEFPKENDSATTLSYIGQTWGDPIITRVTVDVNGTPVKRWVAIVTGGYHPSGDPNDHSAYSPAATEGRAVVILDAMTGDIIAARGFDPTGDCTQPYDPNIPEKHMCYAMPMTPAVYDTDTDGDADLIVVGDLGGQLWKWVIEAPGYDPVNTTHTFSDNDNSVWPFRKFFEAPVYNDGTNNFYKSFFFAPAATIDSGTLWYALGTGERNELLYKSDPGTTDDNNRFYAFKDPDPHDVLASTAVLTEANLANLTTTSTCADVSAFSGYYLIGQEGEKWVTNFDIFNYYVLAGSYIPVPSTDPCEIGGQAYLYIFRVSCGEGYFQDPSTGGATRTLDIGVGLPTDPKITVGTDGKTRVFISKQGGEIVSGSGPPGTTGVGLFYWRELDN